MVSLRSNVWCVLVREAEVAFVDKLSRDATWRHGQKRFPMKEAEVGMLQLQAMDCQSLPQTFPEKGEGRSPTVSLLGAWP